MENKPLAYWSWDRGWCRGCGRGGCGCGFGFDARHVGNIHFFTWLLADFEETGTREHVETLSGCDEVSAIQTRGLIAVVARSRSFAIASTSTAVSRLLRREQMQHLDGIDVTVNLLALPLVEHECVTDGDRWGGCPATVILTNHKAVFVTEAAGIVRVGVANIDLLIADNAYRWR